MTKRKNFDASQASEEVTREQMLAEFKRASEMGLLSQARLVIDLGIDQGQISKILRGDFVFPRGNAKRIFEYARTALSRRPDNNADVSHLREELTRKLMAAWDQTPEGARAMGILLDAVARLRTRRP